MANNILKSKRQLLSAMFLFLLSISLYGQDKSEESSSKKTINLPSWLTDVKLSGYGMVQYQADDKDPKSENSFNLRLARISLDGMIDKKFYWKTQFQFNGNTSSLGASPRLVDLFCEWQQYDWLRLKVGQFKRPFTFENPMHPITQGFMSYSQPVSKLSGFSDRTGEQASNGRDIGIQVQGDLFPLSNGRPLLHYQLGVFNGEGINKKDADSRKDLIGGFWVMPIAGLRVGMFGWTGSRVIDGESVEKNRYALSLSYEHNDWTFRSEYIHSQGYGSDRSWGDKSDGYYALAIAPIIKKKCHVKCRYDLYRRSKSWGSSKTYYELGADYVLSKNFQINVEYARVNDRTLEHHNYNMVDVEVDFKF